MGGKTDRHTGRQTDTCTDRQTDKHGWTNRHTGRQTDTWAERGTDRHTGIAAMMKMIGVFYFTDAWSTQTCDYHQSSAGTNHEWPTHVPGKSLHRPSGLTWETLLQVIYTHAWCNIGTFWSSNLQMLQKMLTVFSTWKNPKESLWDRHQMSGRVFFAEQLWPRGSD